MVEYILLYTPQANYETYYLAGIYMIRPVMERHLDYIKGNCKIVCIICYQLGKKCEYNMHVFL